MLPGSRARIVRCGGRYDPQLVKRSSLLLLLVCVSFTIIGNQCSSEWVSGWVIRYPYPIRIRGSWDCRKWHLYLLVSTKIHGYPQISICGPISAHLCGGLSWLQVSFLLHVKYTLSYRIVSLAPTYKKLRKYNGKFMHYGLSRWNDFSPALTHIKCQHR